MVTSLSSTWEAGLGHHEQKAVRLKPAEAKTCVCCSIARRPADAETSVCRIPATDLGVVAQRGRWGLRGAGPRRAQHRRIGGTARVGPGLRGGRKATVFATCCAPTK